METFLFKTIQSINSSAEWRPFCQGMNVSPLGLSVYLPFCEWYRQITNIHCWLSVWLSSQYGLVALYSAKIIVGIGFRLWIVSCPAITRINGKMHLRMSAKCLRFCSDLSALKLCIKITYAHLRARLTPKLAIFKAKAPDLVKPLRFPLIPWLNTHRRICLSIIPASVSTWHCALYSLPIYRYCRTLVITNELYRQTYDNCKQHSYISLRSYYHHAWVIMLLMVFYHHIL